MPYHVSRVVGRPRHGQGFQDDEGPTSQFDLLMTRYNALSSEQSRREASARVGIPG